MKRHCALLWFAGLALAATMPAVADVIYDNGHIPTDATASDFDFGVQIADDFQLEIGSTTVTRITWWGLCRFSEPSDPDDFAIRIFADGSGAPAENPLYEFTGIDGNRTPTGADISGYLEYEYSADINPVTLAANTTYWISIANNTLDINGFYDWYWILNGPGNGHLFSINGEVWVPHGYEYAFSLTGPAAVVPEPASVTLLGLGLAGLALRRRHNA